MPARITTPLNDYFASTVGRRVASREQRFGLFAFFLYIAELCHPRSDADDHQRNLTLATKDSQADKARVTSFGPDLGHIHLGDREAVFADPRLVGDPKGRERASFAGRTSVRGPTVP